MNDDEIKLYLRHNHYFILVQCMYSIVLLASKSTMIMCIINHTVFNLYQDFTSNLVVVIKQKKTKLQLQAMTSSG